MQFGCDGWMSLKRNYLLLVELVLHDDGRMAALVFGVARPVEIGANHCKNQDNSGELIVCSWDSAKIGLNSAEIHGKYTYICPSAHRHRRL